MKQVRRGLLLLLSGAAASAADLPSGDATIRAHAGASDIVITTTARVAGAIHSLTWNGREFIDSTDHGRQLQSASNGDAGSPIANETFNPTEAGSRRDHVGPRSSSRLLHLVARGNELQTTTQMAFWLAPGETSGGHPAKNTTVLSDHLLTKRVRIGWNGLPHVIEYNVTFSLPVGERHNHFVFEALTGYLPPEFARFLGFNPTSGALETITGPAREQDLPLIFATGDGGHAMGIYSPEAGPRYGQFRFAAERVVKWNCVFRRANPQGVPAGDYAFRQFVIVGDLATVHESMRALHRHFAGTEK